MKVTELIGDVDPRLLLTAEGRREATRFNPLLFAAVYFPHHLKDSNGEMTLCDFHLDMLDWARVWCKPLKKSKAHRDTFIAPRQSGKSTWTFLLLPMWAAAHQHRRFVAAFSDSETQAITHLNTFKTELDVNELLGNDFPDFVAPARASNVGRALMHNRNQIKQANGFIFMAKGADSAALGMKVGEFRPDVLLFDDIEPGESNYSEYEAGKRKETLQSDLFYLNDFAIVGIVGTTTMPNSLIDQMRKVHDLRQGWEGSVDELRESVDQELRWVIDENINVHYWPAILSDDNGDERSLWPERWSLDELNRERHTRQFAKNMMNRPVSLDGGYWEDNDIIIGSDTFGNTLISVDPAVTTGKRSDYTGIAVVSRGESGKVYVRHAEQVKLSSTELKDHIVELIGTYDATLVYVETNQGGDLWKQVFAGIPAKFRSIRQTEKKEIRAAAAHDFYKKGKVVHTGHFPTLEEQMFAFPKVAHDDVLDAVVSAVLYFKKSSGNKVSVKTFKYTEV